MDCAHGHTTGQGVAVWGTNKIALVNSLAIFIEKAIDTAGIIPGMKILKFFK